MKKILSVLLSLLLLCSCIPLGAVQAATAGTVYGTVDRSDVAPGDTFTMSVQMENNPGLVCWLIDVDFDSAALELVSQTKGDAFNGIGTFSFGPMKEGYTNALWYDFLAMDDYTNNGHLFSLTFRVKEGAPAGNYPITLYCSDWDNMCNAAFERVDFDFVSPTVTVVAAEEPECQHEYFSACDQYCMLCGALTNPSAQHVLTHVAAVEATCSTDGNVEYWTCMDCGCCWDNAVAAGVPLNWILTILPATGVHIYSGTTDDTCDVCGAIREVDGPAAIYGWVNMGTVELSDTFMLDVYMKDNPGMVGWNVTVEYDETALELVRQIQGTAFSASGISFGPLKSPASTTFADALNPDVTNNGLMFSLEFKVKDTAAAGVYTFTLGTRNSDMENFFNDCWETVPVNFEDAYVTVAAHTHVYDNAYDADCNICGAIREVPDVPVAGPEATIDFTDKANRVAYSTEQQVWAQNGITVTNDKAASVSNVGDYGGEGYPARFYKGSRVTIEYPGMTKIVIDCTDLDAKYIKGWADSITDDNAAAVVYGSVVTIAFNVPVNSFTWEELSAQCRACSITVNPTEGGDEPEDPDQPVGDNWTVATELKAGVVYKLGMDQITKGAVYYFTGVMSGYYGATATDVSLAADMYVEIVDGGCKLCFFDANGTKQYIKLEQSGNYYNFTFGAEGSVFTLDTARNALYATAGDKICYMGTYGNYVTVGTLQADRLKDTDYIARLYCEKGADTPACPHVYDNDCTDACCNLCGAYREVAGHQYVGVVTEAATCGTVGVMTYTCSACDDAYTEVIPATGAHTYSSATDATCNVCGAIRDMNGTTIYGVISDTAVERGDTFTLDICIRDNPGLVGWNVMVDYNETALELVQKTAGNIFPTTGMSYGPLKSPFSITFVDAVRPDVVGDGVMVHLVFRVKDTAAPGDYIFVIGTRNDDLENFYNQNWDTVPVQFEDISVSVFAHTHTYVSAMTTAPTCGATGVMTYTCSACGDTYTEVIPATGVHAYDNACDAECNVCGGIRDVEPHNYKGTVTAPDCTNDGYTTYVCTACGDTYVDDIVKAMGHNYASEITLAATCGADGVMTYTCSVCGDTYTEVIPATGEHTYKAVVTAPDCINGGYTTYTCTVCGHTYVADHTAALGHSYESEITLAATCGTDGVMTYTCSACGDSYTEVIPATGDHTYDNACDATCNVCGGVREVPGHSFVGSFTCTICGYALNVDSDPIIYGTVDVTDAAPGDTFTLTVHMANNPGLSGWLVGIDYDIQSLELIEQTAGNTFNPVTFGPKNTLPTRASWYDFLSGDTTASGVLFSLTFRVKEGVTTGDTVIRLYSTDPDNFTTVDEQTVYFDFVDAVVSLLDHRHTYDHGCDADCNICGAIREVLAHNYESAVTTAPTCVAEGVMTYTCSVCGDSYTESIPATGEHTYAHPCSVTCSVCGGENPAPAEHTYNHVYDADCDLCGAVREVKMMLGDVNGDGKVNIRDVGILQQYMNGWPVEFPMDVADINGDGKVNIRDVGLYQQYMNGWEVEYPIGKQS